MGYSAAPRKVTVSYSELVAHLHIWMLPRMSEPGLNIECTHPAVEAAGAEVVDGAAVGTCAGHML